MPLLSLKDKVKKENERNGKAARGGEHNITIIENLTPESIDNGNMFNLI